MEMDLAAGKDGLVTEITEAEMWFLGLVAEVVLMGRLRHRL